MVVVASFFSLFTFLGTLGVGVIPLEKKNRLLSLIFFLVLAVLFLLPAATVGKHWLIVLFFSLHFVLLGREILAEEKAAKGRALLLGALAFWFLSTVSLLSVNPLAVIYPDSLDYLRAAGETGDWPWHAVRGPFYPLFIRGLSWIFGKELFPLIVFQNLMCCLGLFGVWKASRPVLGRWPAAFLFLFLMANLEIMLWAHAALADAFGVFFFCLLLAGILKKDIRRVTIAVAVLPAIKANFAYLVPLFALLLLYGAISSRLRYRRAFTVFAISLVPTVGLSLANKVYFGFGNVSNHSGLSLFWVVGNLVDPTFIPDGKTREQVTSKLEKINRAYTGDDHTKLNAVAFDKDSITEIIRAGKYGNDSEAKLFGKLAFEAIRARPLSFSYHVVDESWKFLTYRLGNGFTEVYFNKKTPEKVERISPSEDTIKYRQSTVVPAVLFPMQGLVPIFSWVSMRLTEIAAYGFIVVAGMLILYGGFLGKWDPIFLVLLSIASGHIAIHSIWNWSNGRYQMVVYPVFCLIGVRGLQYLQGQLPLLKKESRRFSIQLGIYLFLVLSLYFLIRSLPLLELPIPGMQAPLQLFHQKLSLFTGFNLVVLGVFSAYSLRALASKGYSQA